MKVEAARAGGGGGGGGDILVTPVRRKCNTMRRGAPARELGCNEERITTRRGHALTISTICRAKRRRPIVTPLAPYGPPAAGHACAPCANENCCYWFKGKT